MRWYAKIVLVPLLAVNLLVALLLVCCAYSPMLPAESMPLLSLAGLAFPFILVANLLFLVLWIVLYRPFLLVSLVTFLLCFSQLRIFCPVNITRQNPPTESLKLLSYNILSTNFTASTANRENPTIAYLENSDADIICLQEFAFDALKKNEEKENLFAGYPYKSYHLSHTNENAARFLCCISKYPILEVERLVFDSAGNGCDKYRVKWGDDTLIVYNCHLQSNSLSNDDKDAYEQLLANPKDHMRSKETKELVTKLREAVSKRAVQADMMAADIRTESSPYIAVCGDFNDSPISYASRVLRDGLMDAYANSGNGPGFSYNRNKLFYRIDHILHSELLESYRCVVDDEVEISDHYPISCYLKKAK